MEILTIILTIAAMGVLGMTTYNTVNNYFNVDRPLSLLTLIWGLLLKPAKLKKITGKYLIIPTYLLSPLVVYGLFQMKMLKCPYCTTFWASVLLLTLFTPYTIPVILTYAFCSMFIGSLYNLICYHSG